jgi:hypothetical protein
MKSTWEFFYQFASVFHVEFLSFHVYIYMDLCTIPEDVVMLQDGMAYKCRRLAVTSKRFHA